MKLYVYLKQYSKSYRLRHMPLSRVALCGCADPTLGGGVAGKLSGTANFGDRHRRIYRSGRASPHPRKFIPGYRHPQVIEFVLIASFNQVTHTQATSTCRFFSKLSLFNLKLLVFH